jgi:predicted RNA methylase
MTSAPTPTHTRESTNDIDARALGNAVREGRELVNDDAFDHFIPYRDQQVSADYWTPLSVATRAAQWLDYFGARSVVDVGSGVGKFCVAAALSSQCTFTGIEHRPRLVETARTLAQLFEVSDRVQFVESAVIDVGWPTADAYYLYNPFGENLCSERFQLDRDVELGLTRYQREIAAAERYIERAPRGTLVLTYNGFGGRVPDSYEEVAVDRELPYELRMWRKARQTGAGRVWRSG